MGSEWDHLERRLRTGHKGTGWGGDWEGITRETGRGGILESKRGEGLKEEVVNGVKYHQKL